MKTARILVILLLALTGLGGIARSQTSTHVYGSDDPAVDVQAVQEAVDTYDVVNLHGTFDFADSKVYIRCNVEILGEGTDANGEYLTRIKGGGWGALSSYDYHDVEWTVRDIEFDGPEAAIDNLRSKSFEVTGCNISLSSPFFGMGIILSYAVTGSVTIEENFIDLSGVGVLGFGVFSQGICADLEVVGNTVENFSLTGLWINTAGNIEITDNTITAGPAGPTGFRNGILIGSWDLPSGNRGNIEVIDNTITTGGHQRDQGITVEDSEQQDRDVCNVEDNVVTYVDDSPSGCGLLLINQSSNWTFKDNTINGGGHEFLAGILVDLECEWNWLLDNKLEDITGDGIILKGDYNMVGENKFWDISGQHIVDEGVGNVIEDND